MAARVLTAVRSHFGMASSRDAHAQGQAAQGQAAQAQAAQAQAVGAGEWLIAGLCALAVVLALLV